MNGHEAAVVSLEVLWNQLIARGRCSLLCGYSSDRVGTDAGFDAICDQHSHVVGESPSAISHKPFAISERSTYTRAAFSAASTRASLNGTRRRRTPVAS